MANREQRNRPYKDNRSKFRDYEDGPRLDKKRYKQSKRKKNHKRDFLENDDMS